MPEKILVIYNEPAMMSGSARKDGYQKFTWKPFRTADLRVKTRDIFSEPS
jgi:hypothetical protein